MLTSDRHGIKLLHRYLDLRTYSTADIGHCLVKGNLTEGHWSFSVSLSKNHSRHYDKHFQVSFISTNTSLPAGSTMIAVGD